jgi:hypothetical protein
MALPWISQGRFIALAFLQAVPRSPVSHQSSPGPSCASAAPSSLALINNASAIIKNSDTGKCCRAKLGQGLHHMGREVVNPHLRLAMFGYAATEVLTSTNPDMHRTGVEWASGMKSEAG